MKLPIDLATNSRVTRAQIQPLVPRAMYGYRRVKDQGSDLAIADLDTGTGKGAPSAEMVKSASLAVYRRYLGVGYRRQIAAAEAERFLRALRQPANSNISEAEFDAELAELSASLGCEQ